MALFRLSQRTATCFSSNPTVPWQLHIYSQRFVPETLHPRFVLLLLNITAGCASSSLARWPVSAPITTGDEIMNVTAAASLKSWFHNCLMMPPIQSYDEDWWRVKFNAGIAANVCSRKDLADEIAPSGERIARP